MRCVLERKPEDNRQAPVDLEQIKTMLHQLSAAERKAFIASEAAELLTPQELAELKSRGYYRSNVRLLHNLSRGDDSARAEPTYHDRSLAKVAQPRRDTTRLPELPEELAALPVANSRFAAAPTLTDPTPPKVRPPRPAYRANPWLDRGLLAVEWICAIVIIFILGQWVYTQWNSDDGGNSAVAQSEPSPIVPAQPALVVTPAKATPLVSFSPTPLPAHPAAPTAQPMGATAQANPPPAATTTLPPPTNTPLPAMPTSDAVPVRIVIPSIKVDSVIKEVELQVDTWQVADYAVGHHQSSALPGQQGNVVMAGHRDIRGSVFRRLNELKPNDVILVYTKMKVYRYIVSASYIVKPTQVGVMSQTKDYRLTLITCTPIGIASHRIIVVALLDRNDVPVIGGDQ
jgi:sortase A